AVGQLEIQQKKVDCAARQGFACAGEAGRLLDLGSRRGPRQRRAQRGPEQRMVVGDDDTVQMKHLRRAATRSRPWSRLDQWLMAAKAEASKCVRRFAKTDHEDAQRTAA